MVVVHGQEGDHAIADSIFGKYNRGPRFSGGDPTNWLSKVKQFFTYQGTPEEHRVPYASYHLDDEANEWWQAISTALEEDHTEITWNVFEDEIWVRFGPTDCEDFDEALSKIQQTGSLREYQREFERLQNKVRWWTQKALVGTFIGRLQPSISDHIRMFLPKSLKEATMYARMRDEQLQKIRRLSTNSHDEYLNASSSNQNQNQNTMARRDTTTMAPKRLSWEDILTKRALGLCFSCDERYTPEHKCRKPHLLLMEAEGDEEDDGTEP